MFNEVVLDQFPMPLNQFPDFMRPYKRYFPDKVIILQTQISCGN